MKNDRIATLAYILAVVLSLAVVAMDLFVWRAN